MAYNSPDVQIRYPREIVRHYEQDIAIILLKSPLNFSNTVQPINLPKFNYVSSIKSTTAIQYGWSIQTRDSEYFSELQVSTRLINASDTICMEILDKLSPQNNYCAISKTCNTGDHGSPLVAFDEFGIVSL